jgi:hypothetical protein
MKVREAAKNSGLRRFQATILQQNRPRTQEVLGPEAAHLGFLLPGNNFVAFATIW